jgi:hypothetical protein
MTCARIEGKNSHGKKRCIREGIRREFARADYEGRRREFELAVDCKLTVGALIFPGGSSSRLHTLLRPDFF